MGKLGALKSGGGSSGGIGGSGIFGGVGVGAVVACKSEDTSWYCTLTKFFHMFFQIIAFLVVIYLIVTVAFPMIKKWMGWK